MRFGLTSTSKIRGARVSRMAPIEPGLPGAGSTRLPDNSYVLNADLEAMKQSWPEGYKILTEQGYTAYSMAVADAKTAIAKQAVATTDIKAKYSALTEKQKGIMPSTALKIGVPMLHGVEMPPLEPFSHVIGLSPTATEIPEEPGFYAYTTSKVTKRDVLRGEPSGDPTGTMIHFTDAIVVYARTEDGSVAVVDKYSKPRVLWDPVIGDLGGATHEQKMGASKLSKEMGVPYEQALGLVSASGYYDKNAIAKVTTTIPEQAEGAKWQKFGDYRYIEASGGGYIIETPSGEKMVSNVAPVSGSKVEEWEGYRYIKATDGNYLVIDPKGKVSWPSAKEGQEYWASYTPEVASAIKKLKPFEKKDGTYDWVKILLSTSTPVTLAATKVLGVDVAGLKGIKDSIKAYPELGKALSEGGLEGYGAKWESMHIKLADNKWMTINDWGKLYEYDQEHGTNYQAIGIKQGYDVMLTTMDDDQKAAEVALKDYKVLETDPFYVQGEDNYYLEKAIRDKIDEKHLLVIFGKDIIDEAKGKPKEVPFPTTTPVEPTVLKEYWPKGVPSTVPEGFPSDAEYAKLSVKQKLDLGKLGDVRAQFGVKTWVVGVKRAETKYGVEQPIPSLQTIAIYPLDPIYQDINNRLKADPKNPQIQAEMDVYKEQWGRGGITTAAVAATIVAPVAFGAIGAIGTQLVTKIPAVIRAIPLLGKIPQAAVILAQYLGTAAPIAYTGATIAEAIQTTDLEHKWQSFEALPATQQDAWAKKIGYDSFPSLTDSEKANVLLHYAVPPGYSLSQWSGTLGEYTERLIELSGQSLAWLQENAPEKVRPMVIPLRIAGGVVVGAVVEATSYMAQLPLIASTMVDKVPSGTSKEFATEVAIGMAAFFTTAIPAAFKADPYFTSGRLVGLFLLSPQAILKLTKAGFAGFKPSYIPERAMGMEFSTIKVKFTATQAGLLIKMSPAELKALGTEITATLLAGKNYVKNFGNLKLEVETVPYQKVVGNALWHFTPDITKFKGVTSIKGKLFTSPQAAVKAGLQSLVKGQKATHPGLVEVRVPEGFTIKGAPIDKLLGRGVEIEAPLAGILDPIPGWQGKGVSSNAYFGSYPIRRFTLQGVDTPIVNLTLGKLIELRAMVAKEAVADAFLGWHGRMRMFKNEIAANEALGTKLKKIDAEIASLQKVQAPKVKVETAFVDAKEAKIDVTSVAESKGRLKGDIFDKEGNIVKEAKPFWNQKVGGMVRRRVTAVVLDDVGRLLLVTDSLEPKGYYGLPGGNLRVEHLLPGAEKLKVGDAAYLQVQSEVGFGVTGMKELPPYLGQVNRHSLPGSYLLIGKAEGTKIDVNWFVKESADLLKDPNLSTRERAKLSHPELSEGIWWDGKSTVTVSPATYDIIVKLVKEGQLKDIDITKLKISDKTPSELLTARDTNYYRPKDLSVGGVDKIATRTGATIGLKQLETPENVVARIDQLKHDRSELTSPSLGDFLRGETDFALLAELIKGRQRAVKWSAIKSSETPKFAKDLISNIKEIVRQAKSMSDAKIRELYGISKAELLKRFDTNKLREAKTTEAFNKEVERLVTEEAKLANKRLAQEDIRAYIERGDYFNRRYVSYLDRAIRALGVGIRYEKLPSELARYRPTPEEIYREYRAVELRQRYAPARYEPYRATIAEARAIPYRSPQERAPQERVPPERVPSYRPPPRKPPPYEPPPPHKPPLFPPALTGGGYKGRDYKGAVAWRQGALKRKGAIVPVYKVWRYPYRQEDLDTFFQNELPPGVKVTPGGAKSAYKSIQLYKGKVPPTEAMQADIGAVLVTVKAPTPSPGRAGAITFKKDVKGIRGTSKEALRKLPLGTTLTQIVEGNYPSKIPRNTVDKLLTQKLGTMTSEQIAQTLKDTGMEAEGTAESLGMAKSLGAKESLAKGKERKGYTQAEVLKRLPDSKRREVERLLTEAGSYAPTRGYPKFVVANSKLSRKKKTVRPTNQETLPSISMTR